MREGFCWQFLPADKLVAFNGVLCISNDATPLATAKTSDRGSSKMIKTR